MNKKAIEFFRLRYMLIYLLIICTAYILLGIVQIEYEFNGYISIVIGLIDSLFIETAGALLMLGVLEAYFNHRATEDAKDKYHKRTGKLFRELMELEGKKLRGTKLSDEEHQEYAKKMTQLNELRIQFGEPPAEREVREHALHFHNNVWRKMME